MPKRGGGRIRNWKDNDHFEHDDRTNTKNTRRVIFKVDNNKKGKNKLRWNDPSKLFLDDDIDMGTSRGQGVVHRKGPFRGRGGRLNSPAPRPGQTIVRKKFHAGLLPWYKVIIPYGARHERDVILKALLSYVSPEVFIPQFYKISGNASLFYVDDAKIAEKLFYADRKITMSDGFKLIVIVRNEYPQENIDDAIKEKMKLAMVKRYNAATKALDLTKFHSDSDLSDVFCALCRPLVMLAVIDIIADNIPDLEALNLNDNKLYAIEPLKEMCVKLKNLKILYMGDNKIPHIRALDSLRPLPLVELYLKGNPLVDKFNDHDVYASDVRRKFPKLIKLDGEELPPAIGFDVTEDATLPPRQQSFLIDPAGQDLLRDFLTQYFTIYDSESRQPLLDAYHEHATLSLTANYLTYHDNRNAPSTKLNAYILSSRNLIRITERESRRRFLKTGRLQVVTFLSELPKTSHDLMGFAVDLLVFTPTMIVLTVNGVFRETMTPSTPCRSFHRTFVVVPNNTGGFCIINDMLFVTNTTREQDERAFASGSVPVAPVEAPPQPSPSVTATPADQHSTLINLLSQETGMNHHWSMNCLQETAWDPQRALYIFKQLQSEGKIPPEAFIK